MYLRDYQRDGVRFLFRQYAQKQGGILGDDMVIFYCPLPPFTPALLPSTPVLQTRPWLQFQYSCFPAACSILTSRNFHEATTAHLQANYNVLASLPLCICMYSV